MPWIVTTKRPKVEAQRNAEMSVEFPDAPDPDPPVSRRAVASLEDARWAVELMPAVAAAPNGQVYYDEMESWEGDEPITLPPLPDGTTIEVEARTWEELATGRAVLEHMGTSGWSEAQQQILNAFNAREAGR